MRLSWAQGAIVALSLTAAIGLLDTPARLLGPASVAEAPLSLPRASTPSIVIAALPTPHLPARISHAPRLRPPSAAPALAVGLPPVALEQPSAQVAVQPTLVAPAAVIVAPRRTPPDEPRPTPTPAPAPVPDPDANARAATDAGTDRPDDACAPPGDNATPRAGDAPTGAHTRPATGGGFLWRRRRQRRQGRLPRGERERPGRQP